MGLQQFLKAMLKAQASDLFINPHAPPMIKVHGQMMPVDETLLTPQRARALIFSTMDNEQTTTFLEEKESNFAYHLPEVGRFRISAYMHKNMPAMVVRHISTKIPSLQALNLPASLKPLIMGNQGLFILVGATGTGKSTTLAALLDYRNQRTHGHMMCIEDPIEYIHEHKKSLITQREIGIDTESYEIALKNALRQSPDVISIGEIRCQETMQHALAFAETGHLCVATLHANNANQALERILHFYPKAVRAQIRLDLSLNLRGIVAQKLIPAIDQTKRALALELLINTPVIAHHIKKGEIDMLKEYMQRKNPVGMQTFDQSLYRLAMKNKISKEEALHHADSANNLRLKFKLNGEKGAATLPEKDLKMLDARDY